MKIDAKEFKAKLDILKPALARSSSISELQHFMFDGDFAYAFDGSLGIRVPFATQFEGCLLGSTLLGVFQNAPSEVEATEEKHGLKFSLGRTKISLPKLDAKSFPWRYPTEWKGTQITITEEFIEALRKTSCIKVKKPARVEHHGVTMFSDGKGVLLYATDSKSMAEAYAPVKLPKGLDRVVLPHAFVEQIIDLGHEGDKLHFSEFSVLEAKDALVFSSWLDTSTVQDLPQVISALVPAEGSYSVLPPEFKAMLTHADLLAKGMEKAYVTLTTKGKELIVVGGFKSGSLDSTFPLSHAAPKASIQVELTPLQTGLARADSFDIAERALVLSEGKDFLFLIAAYEERRKPPKSQETSDD